MSTFFDFFRLGFEHVSGLPRYDIVFLAAAMCAVYMPAGWRRPLGLLTVFTVGHALTHVLTALRLVAVSGPFIEVLAALTVMGASVLGIWQAERERRVYRSASDPIRFKYALVFGFGLIHGLSPLLQPVSEGSGSQLVPLLAFSVGLEAGQIAVLLALLALSLLMVRLARLEESSWKFIVLGATAGAALLMLLERLPMLIA